MAALDSGFPCCLCVAMKKSFVPEAQLPAKTLETRGSDAVEELIVKCQNTKRHNE